MKFPVAPYALDHRSAHSGAHDPRVGLAVEQLLKTAVGVGFRVISASMPRRRKMIRTDAYPRFRSAKIRFPQVAQCPDLATRQHVHSVMEQLGDIMHAPVDVRNVVLGLHELKRVGGDESHVDILEPQDVDEILERALAEDRQHPKLLAVVEHVGHVGSHDRHGAADWCRDHRDSDGIEGIAVRQGARQFAPLCCCAAALLARIVSRAQVAIGRRMTLRILIPLTLKSIIVMRYDKYGGR